MASATAVPVAQPERAIQELVSKGTLRVPPYPAADRARETLGRRGAGLPQVAQLVCADAALAAAIVRCARSALYRSDSPATDLWQSMARIGAAEGTRLPLASGPSTGAQEVGPLGPGGRAA